jgi:hypothetical protein
MTPTAPAFQESLTQVEDPAVLNLLKLLDQSTQQTIWELCESLDESIRESAFEAVQRFEDADADVRELIAAMKNHATNIALEPRHREALQMLLAAAKQMRADT